jgi:SOS-response transcriptional repressor LexA
MSRFDNNISDRVHKILKFNNLSFYSAEKKLGIGNGILGKIVNKGMSPSYDVLAKMLSFFPEIDANWLLLGEGKMLKKQELEYFEKGNVIFIEQRAAAGFGSLVMSKNELNFPSFNLPFLSAHIQHYCLPVVGDSMQPTIHNGDYVICHAIKAEELGSGLIHVLVSTDNEVYLKRIIDPGPKADQLIMRSDNYTYREQYIAKEQVHSLYQVTHKISGQLTRHLEPGGPELSDIIKKIDILWHRHEQAQKS